MHPPPHHTFSFKVYLSVKGAALRCREGDLGRERTPTTSHHHFNLRGESGRRNDPPHNPTPFSFLSFQFHIQFHLLFQLVQSGLSVRPSLSKC